MSGRVHSPRASGRATRARALMLAGALLASGAPCAQTADRLVMQALDAYRSAQSHTERTARVAQFERAERLFAEAARIRPTNADLHANAGTAALQAERLGPAVLALRRALARDPDHARARRNLSHARALLPDWVPRPADDDGILDTFFFWHRSLSIPERGAGAAMSFLLAALLLAIGIRWRSGAARGAAALPALIWLGLAASLAVDAGAGGAVHAVVVAEEAVARAADSPNAPARLARPLPGGTEVEVLERRERWARVHLANRLEAWLPVSALEAVRASHREPG